MNTLYKVSMDLTWVEFILSMQALGERRENYGMNPILPSNVTELKIYKKI